MQRGDFLSSIAAAAYGEATAFTQIYRANSRAIGPNPALIRAGMSLRIPCLDGDLVPSTASTETVGRGATVEALPSPAESRPIRVLAATDWGPFTNEEQDQGGMLTDIINVALEQADGDPDYQIDFVNDWNAHLQPLISDHAYDFSIG
ncbi:LysM peptidoglycan-binding domain-containing protein [Actibacterium sp. 188UL27-1]|uniref:LysM peptidoglycan-binding domain-containing protein n=1 Tax=Actibacterium sp. 188UL27-1 TaxID=2786961 RepID=UPI00195727BD|nr:LysM peptidoglycan-binding domain-containing protein [Actibacterium sp. 188UL27-1]